MLYIHMENSLRQRVLKAGVGAQGVFVSLCWGTQTSRSVLKPGLHDSALRERGFVLAQLSAQGDPA